MNFILVCSLAILCLVEITHQQKCDQAGLKKFDEITSSITTFGNINMRFPENPDQLKTWCKSTTNYISENEKYNNKCNKQLFKQIFKMYIYGFRRTLKLYCKAGSKLSNSLMDSAPCFNQNKNLEISCITTFIDHLLGAQNDPDDKKKIPHLCCSFNKFISCLSKKMTNASGCNESKITAMADFIKSQATNALDLMCGDYKDDSDKCDVLGDPPKKKKSQRRSKSLAIPTADLLASFQEI